MPEVALARARAVLAQLEAGHGPSGQGRGEHKAAPQLELFAGPAVTPSAVESTLRELDIDQLTPLQALLALAQLKALL